MSPHPPNLWQRWRSIVGLQGIEQREDVTPEAGKVMKIGVSKNNSTPKWMVYNGKPY